MNDGNSSTPFLARPTKNRGWRKKGPFALFALVCSATLIVTFVAATNPLSASPFALSGHWVYNSVLRGVFHIDGPTGNIDAQAAVDGEPGSQVVQGDLSGYVVGLHKITEFGKDDLAARQGITPPVDEVPVGVEGVGGPYLVYRNAGLVVRLGNPSRVVPIGGAVGDPVLTSDGTMWLHRTGVGSICTLPKDADRPSGCPVQAPENHAGALTVVGDRLAFVDFFSRTVSTVDGDHLGQGTPLGVPLSPNSRAAAQDVAGRVAILDLERHTLSLADTASPPAPPVTIGLSGGDYDGPVSTGSAVVLVDRQTGNVLTYGPDGAPKDTKPIRDKAGKPRLTRGEDNRVYVEDADGTQVVVVAKDGGMKDVPVAGKPTGPSAPPAPVVDTKTGEPGRQGGEASRQGGESDRPRGGDTSRPPPPPPPIPATAPGAPTGVAATAGDGSAVVTWGAAADNRAAVTSYQVSWQGGSMTVSGGARRVNVNGLTNGTRYVFTVTATNKMGAGPGASAAATPFAVATAPTVNAVNQGNGAVRVTWTAPDMKGGTLQHYQVSATGQADQNLTGNSTTYNGLAAGRTYTFTVRAITKSGDGQTLIGTPGSASVNIPAPPAKRITISEGQATTSGNCRAPNCARVDANGVGFTPGPHDIRLSSSSNTNVQTETVDVRADGSWSYSELDYDVPGQTVWITVDGVQSNKITWKSP
ncbi:fibronectin type III domain-containing protein [Actinocrispum wychmicini]|uniref:Fibronectin type III domain protein n=1 Tax=Actinocrispum wychmicini TaxID=1213861 RepID=A0A4R2IK98_9PSEU|nr:fibronectin type III domain-containing protein [Actinocrispum wychmicini]TCO44278.1 fibronectin type III domain protein [Actinocrispum wychmicini]